MELHPALVGVLLIVGGIVIQFVASRLRAPTGGRQDPWLRPATCGGLPALPEAARNAEPALDDPPSLPDVRTLDLQVHVLPDTVGGPIPAPALVCTHEADAVEVGIAIAPVVGEDGVVGYVARELPEPAPVPVLTPTGPAAVARPFEEAVSVALTQATAIASERGDRDPA